MKKDTILIFDFGSQYTHLISNRIRRLGVYTEIKNPEEKFSLEPYIKGIILSGGPASVYDKNRPKFNEKLFKDIKNGTINIPILGICYGHQLLSYELGGAVKRGNVHEYGKAIVEIYKKTPLTEGLNEKEVVWMSHGDEVDKLPEGFELIGSSSDCKTAIIGDIKRNIYGLQFHPEVTHTINGIKILDNFVKLTKAKRTWSIEKFYKEIQEEIKQKVGNKKVFLLVSGGVDSTVAFALLKNVLGDDNVIGVHVDTGLMRKNETAEIEEYLKEHNFSNLIIKNYEKKFLESLKEIYDPEEKRKIIGRLFLDVNDEISEEFNINPDDFILAQGTIYPDTIESGGTKNAAIIKTHHNRVDKILELIEQGKIIEPLKELYKDEVRKLGELLGLPKHLVWRHPFPGPGLGVRVLCLKEEFKVDPSKEKEIIDTLPKNFYGKVLPIKSVGVQGDYRTYAHPFALITDTKDWNKLEEVSSNLTNKYQYINRVILTLYPNEIRSLRVKPSYITKERLELLREIDYIAHNILEKRGIYYDIWQMPVVLVPLFINDTEKEIAILRPVLSKEAMTAEFYKMQWDILEEIIDNIKEYVSGIFYDITNKPPGTIEWE